MSWPTRFREPARAVTEALDEVESPGNYYATGASDEYPQPGLHVDGLDLVGFPLSASSVKAIINKSHLAPYGHGEETIVNTQVRDTWELNAQTQFTLQNPVWQHFIDRITAACARDLGIDPTTHNVTAKPYKLLNTKTARKNTTESFTWDPSVGSMFSVQYAAFYGDCEHDVKAVTSGYRVCLTYNFMSDSSNIVTPDPENDEAYRGLCAAIDKFFVAEKVQKFLGWDQLVYMLEHKYTKQGLSFDFLKNRDVMVARCISRNTAKRRARVRTCCIWLASNGQRQRAEGKKPSSI